MKAITLKGGGPPVSMKQRARRLCGRPLQRLGFASGVMGFAARLRRIEGAIILMYHSVAAASQSGWIDPANHVPADIFARQMEFLFRHKRVISLADLVTTLGRGRTPPAGTVVITFDDGYLDNLTVAAPILEHYRLPATLFLPTAYIDRQENQWIDQAYAAFKFRGGSWLDWSAATASRFNLADPWQERAGYRMVCGALLSAGAQERRALLNELHDRLRPVSTPPRLTMNWDEIRTLLARHRRFSVGGHTREHLDLTTLSGEMAKKELTACRGRIEDELGVLPRFFSFCYGRASKLLCRLAAEAGFEAACGEDGRDPVIAAPADLHCLPRVAAPASMRRFDLLTSSANTGIWRRLGR